MRLTILTIAFLGVCVSAQAQVSLKEKNGLIHFHDNFLEVAPAVSPEALKRELNYEKLNLQPASRAAAEARYLAEQIQKQVIKAYENALAATNDADDAAAQVRVNILKELNILDKKFRPEVKKLALKTLEEIRVGGVAAASPLPAIQKQVQPDIEARAPHTKALFSAANLFVPSEQGRKDSEKLEYDSIEEFTKLLISNKESTRWVATSNTGLYTEWLSTKEAKISAQLKVNFLGVDLVGGPEIMFQTEVSTRVNIMAEGLSPVLLPDGNFDVYKRDEFNNVLLDETGKPVRRFIAFNCEAGMNAMSEYSGELGLIIEGVGGVARAAKSYRNGVTMYTRRVLVPNYVAGKTVTKAFLNKFCHDIFIDSHASRTSTVRENLRATMKNMLSSLYFSHARTKCSVNTDCQQWFDNEVSWLYRSSTTPVCAEEQREKFRECQLRSLEGMSCRLKGVADPSVQLDCASGLKCVQFREGNFFTKPKGRCEKVPSTIVDFEVM